MTTRRFRISTLSVLIFATLMAPAMASDAFEMSFKEDLRFGAEEDGLEYHWTDAQLACDFDVADNGHIYVIDQRSTTIYEFDETGSFVRQLASKGQGPGEYQTIAAFSIYGDKAIGVDFLNGAMKTHSYGASITHENSAMAQNVYGFLFKAKFADNLGFAQMIRPDKEGKTVMRMDVVDHGLQIRKNITSIEWPSQMANPSDPNSWVAYLGLQMRSFWAIANNGAGFLADGRLVIADANKDKYEIWSKDGSELIQTLNVPSQATPFSDKLKGELVDAITTIIFKQSGPQIRSIVTENIIEKAVDYAQLPARFNPVFDIEPISNTTFAAVTHANMSSGEVTIDVVDTQKGHRGLISLPDRGIFSIFGTRLKFKNGYAYAMVWSDDDENQIVRYKYNLPK